MCNKCEAFHSKLLQNHQIYNIEKVNSGEIINDYCQENNHNIELQYYCKNHNQLCCAKCITKIKDKGNGMHKDCDIYTIEDIKNEKMNQLNKNIKNLELLSKNLHLKASCVPLQRISFFRYVVGGRAEYCIRSCVNGYHSDFCPEVRQLACFSP